MAQSILVFDFGTNEEAAQQARHKVEAWKQGFRLGNKLQLKFERDRVDPEKTGAAEKPAGKPKAAKTATGAAKSANEQADGEGSHTGGGRLRLLVRLEFSGHEKLSHQRWLERIPTEEPFKSAEKETFRAGDPDFAKTAERFESLD
jgi:hypothetical protein